MERNTWKGVLAALALSVMVWLAVGLIGLFGNISDLFAWKSSLPMWKEAEELPPVSEAGPWLAVSAEKLEHAGDQDRMTFWMYTEEGTTLEMGGSDLVIVDFELSGKWYTVYEEALPFKVKSGYGMDQGPKEVELRFPPGLFSAKGGHRIRFAKKVGGELAEAGSCLVPNVG